jgi:hypothetical protein
MTDKKQDEVLESAKKRYEYALVRNSHNRDKARADLRFFAATPDDPWQWDEVDVNNRRLSGRPILTINKAPQHVRQVTNDIRQNRPSIKYRPADSKADVKVADILMGLARHIEANSDADTAYDMAAEPQVQHGTGYIRVLADYVSEDSFDQDIFIRPVEDPFKVTDDPDSTDPAGADRKFLFIEESLTEDEFKKQFPKAEPIDWNFDTRDGQGWFDGGAKKVRIAEYFEVCYRDKKLFMWENGATSWEGEPVPVGVLSPKPIKERTASQRYVMWRKINGKEVLEEKEFPSKYIPFARAWGNVAIVDGKRYVWGLVRPMKDSLRMYNVAQSAIVERVMQAPKAPWVAPIDAIEGYEEVWRTANTASHAFLPYNHVDPETKEPIPAPVRVQSATIEPGLMSVVQASNDDMKAETGQYDASLGQRSNETSGKAIMARQREGDMATFHYVDNLAKAVRHVGRIILDMIPRIYDTRRIARILGEDGSPNNATLDPKMPEAYAEMKRDDGQIEQIFNPNVGTYDVYTTTGPSFTTRRQEAVEAMSQMTQANPELWRVIGDKLVAAMDWPGAEEMADRLRSVLLPEVRQAEDEQGEIPPQLKAVLEQMQQQMAAMQESGAVLQAENEELKSKKEVDLKKLLIDAYKAETERLQVVGQAMTPEAVQALVMQTLQQVLTSPDPTPTGPEPMPDLPAEMIPQEPASAGFFMPEQGAQPAEMPVTGA